MRENRTLGLMRRGLENRPTVRLVRHSQRKRGATDRLNLRGNWRQSSTLQLFMAFLWDTTFIDQLPDARNLDLRMRRASVTSSEFLEKVYG